MAKRAQRYNTELLQRSCLSILSHVLLFMICSRKKEHLSSIRKTQTDPRVTSFVFSVIPIQHFDIIARDEPSDVDGWLRVLSQVAKDFATLTGGSTKQYMDEHIIRYLSNPNQEAFESSTHAVDSIDSRLHVCHRALLQLDGASNNLKKVCELQATVRELLHCLDEATCYAVVGHSEVAAMHKLSQLRYQSL